VVRWPYPSAAQYPCRRRCRSGVSRKKSQGKNVNFSTDFTESDIIRSAVSRRKFLDEHFFRKMQT